MKKKNKIKITPKPLKTDLPEGNRGMVLKRGDKPKNVFPIGQILKKYKLVFVGILFLMISSVIFFNLPPESVSTIDPDPISEQKAPPLAEEEPTSERDLDLTQLLAKMKKMKDYKQKLMVLDTSILIESLLLKEDMSMAVVNELVYLAKRKNINKLEKGKTWYSVKAKNNDGSDKTLFIYEMSPSQYYLINAFPEPEIKTITKAEHVKIQSIAGVIKTSLWDAVRDSKGDTRVIEKIEDALKWVVDFYHVKPNDKFKIIYEEKWVEDKMIDVGKLLAITFYTNKKRYNAFYFKDDKVEGYFDKKGRTMKRKFLKSPVKYNKITSSYNPKRVHPVLGGVRAHLGTDFFARKADPIYAVADGVITKATHKKNNGNYIKIRHDKTYETQYLHIMDDGFAEGIKRGAKVKQGQVIGYAGETGLATGVHVCYRFWKNGKQVDPMLEDVVQSEVPALLDKESFESNRDSLLDQLYEIPFFDLSF